MNTENPIVDEVRRVREEILASYDGDLGAMMRAMMKKQFQRGREVVRVVPQSSHDEAKSAVQGSET